MPDRLHFGIIGFGRFAEKTILPAIRKSKHAEVVAIQKRDPIAAAAKAGELKIPKAFNSVFELVRDPDVDAVFIASANAMHATETIAAAYAGKHIIVEKPIAMNAQEARQMVEAARERGVKLMVAHMTRFSNAVNRLKEIARSGWLGSIASAEAAFAFKASEENRPWVFDPMIAGGGPVVDIGVHCIDAVRWVLGMNPVAVSAWTTPVRSREVVERRAFAVLQFPGNIPAVIRCSFEEPYISRIEVRGTSGVISLSPFSRSDADVLLTKQNDGGETKEMVAAGSAYAAEIDNFAEAVLRGAPLVAPGEEGFINQCIIDAIYESAANSGARTVVEYS